MANKHEDEYFFDDADNEHFGSEEPNASEGMVYEHDSEDDAQAFHEESVQFEEPNAKWQVFQDHTVSFVTKNKRVVAIVGVAILALIAVHFLPLGKKVHHAASHVQAMPAPQPEHTEKLANNFHAQRSNQVEQTINRVDNQVSRQSEAMEILARAMDKISKKNGDTLQTVSSLEGRLASLSKQVSSLQAKLSAVTTANNVHSSAKKTSLAPSVTFYVRAVEPGRAWLLGSNNAMVSVSVGATIPGYGRVTKIDDERGVVYLDTGEKIGFAPEHIS